MGRCLYGITDAPAHRKLTINPLMPVYWTFRLDEVARRVLYLDEMKATEDYSDVGRQLRL